MMYGAKVVYRSVDGFRKARTFKSLKGAQKFAQHYLGETPTFGTGYAVSDDGVGKVTVSGYFANGDYATVGMLFPKAAGSLFA